MCSKRECVAATHWLIRAYPAADDLLADASTPTSRGQIHCPDSAQEESTSKQSSLPLLLC
jgi:hypothetical protein